MRANATIFGMIVAVPFLVLSGRTIYEGHQVAFAIFSLVLISSMIENVPLSVFGYYAAGYVAVDFVRGMVGNVYPAYPYESLGLLMFVLLGMVLVYAVIRSNAKKEFFFNAICILAIAQMALAFMQSFAGFDPYIAGLNLFIETMSTIPSDFAIGTMGNNNYLSGYLAMAFPFFLRKNWVYAIPAILVLLYLCNTSTAIAAFGAAAAFYLLGFKKYRLILPIVVLAAFASYVVVTEGGAGQTLVNDVRWKFWGTAIDKMIDGGWWSILFGLGLGGKTGISVPLHNEWVQTAFHLGVVGIGIVVWFLATLKTNDRLLKASIVAIVVDCMGNHPMHLIPSAILIMVVLALAARDGMEIKIA